MSMKKNVIVMLVLACLPLWMVAQNTNDDLYFIPKKKVEKKKKEVVETKSVPTTEYVTAGTPVVVKDVKGNVRDVDEYNRRYTSRDNYFSMENDTLYIEEKPYNERGEWVNGFDGTQSDYEYAMRIIRFRNPSYAIPVSSPLYWDIVYGSPSWEWNVFNDGFYAYVFPTFSNSLWWDWHWNWSWNWGWGPSWHYGWHHPYWSFGAHWHHPHYGYHYSHHYHYGWGGTGGYWGNKHGWNGSSATRPGVHAGRYKNNYQGRYASTGTSNRRVVTGENRNSRDRYVNGVRQSNTRNDRTNRVSSGRVVTAKDATGASSVRPQRSATRTRTDGSVTSKGNNGTRNNNTYTRQAESQRSSYTRQSSTRSTVKNSSSGQRRSEAAERGAYRNNSSATRSSSYDNSSSSSSSRNSYSSGGSSRSSSGGGASRSGGGSRSAGRR